MVRLCSPRPVDYARMLDRIGIGWGQEGIGLKLEGRTIGVKGMKKVRINEIVESEKAKELEEGANK